MLTTIQDRWKGIIKLTSEESIAVILHLDFFSEYLYETED